MRLALCIACAALSTMLAGQATGSSSATWTSSTTNPFNAVSTRTIEGASAVSAEAATPACASVSVTWAPSSGATAYHVERSVTGADWQSLSTTTATSWTDTAGHSNSSVAYRITPLMSGTSWTGVAGISPALNCGVTGLLASNPCSSTDLTWNAATRATTYDVEYSTNSGSTWTRVATDIAGTSYTDPTMHASGSSVLYRVRPGVGTADDAAWSASASIASWQNFRLQSVSVANSGTLGTLNAGDTITMAFSKPVDLSTVGSDASIAVVKNPGPALRLAWTGSVAQIGVVTPATSIFGASATYTGTRSWNGTSTTLTWTSTAAGTTMSTTLSGTFAPGTAIRCAADGSQLAASPAPVMSGRW